MVSCVGPTPARSVRSTVANWSPRSFFGGEQVLKYDLRYCIAIDVDERFVHGIGPKFSGVRRRQRVDIQDQDGPVWMIGLLKGVVVSDVDRVSIAGDVRPGASRWSAMLPLFLVKRLRRRLIEQLSSPQPDDYRPSPKLGQSR